MRLPGSLLNRKTTGLMFLLMLAACGNEPDAIFERGCTQMMTRHDSVTEGERITFCTCLTEKTAGLTEEDRLTLGRLMKSTSDGQSLRTEIEEAHEREELSKEGAAFFLTTSMRCSVEMVL